MSESDKPLVHLVDDDEAIRHSASFMLRLAGYRVQTHKDGVSFLDDLPRMETGCILLDVQMPKMSGLAVQKELNARGVDMPVVVLTGHGDVSVAVQAMKAGAMNFVEKPYEKQVLLNALEDAFEEQKNRSMGSLQKADAEKRLAHLTPRETEVLEGLVDGLTNKAIANSLDISPRTVEIHRANMMEKLGVDNLSSALRIAFAAGLGG
ncbi:response regulator transcription factor [Henriciella aquimarina]|uniref:response regulator transcription factor n=1 Tax=Henriciella aquimarina TaxID=545261 RepID=UPI000A00B899|nr:response regulator [Henriciella aquimarina]